MNRAPWWAGKGRLEHFPYSIVKIWEGGSRLSSSVPRMVLSVWLETQEVLVAWVSEVSKLGLGASYEIPVCTPIVLGGQWGNSGKKGVQELRVCPWSERADRVLPSGGISRSSSVMQTGRERTASPMPFLPAHVTRHFSSPSSRKGKAFSSRRLVTYVSHW